MKKPANHATGARHDGPTRYKFGVSHNSCFTGSGRVRALRPNLEPVMPRAGARVPPGPKFGKAGTLSEIGPLRGTRAERGSVS